MEIDMSLSIGLVVGFLGQLIAVVKMLVTLTNKVANLNKEIEEVKAKQKEELVEFKLNQKEIIEKMEMISFNLNETVKSLAVCKATHLK